MDMSIYADIGLTASNAESKVGAFGSDSVKGEHHASIAGKNAVVFSSDLRSDRVNLFGFAIMIGTLTN
jgi:opacity protein-like surface antigen